MEEVLQSVKICRSRGRPRWLPKCLAGDKGYSYPRVRRWVRRHGIGAVIPQRKYQRRRHRGRPLKFSKALYRRRNAVERCVGWIEEDRRVATRYEKLKRNDEGMFELAMIQLLLHVPFPNKA